MKVKILGADRVTQSFKKVLKNLPDQLFHVIGRRAVAHIKSETQKGISIPQNSPLKPLAPSTIERRERLAQFNRTDKAFSPGKSNLTLTGQLLKSLQFEVKKSGSLFPIRKVLVGAKGPRKPYKTGKRKSKARAPTNEEVAKFVSEERPFMGISNQFRRSVRELVAKEVIRAFRKKGFR